MTPNRLKRLMLAAALGFSVAAHAQQQAAPASSYAVMSLLGDKLTLSIYQIATGSRLDANRRIEMPLPDDALDGVAAFAADDAIKRLQPGAQTRLFSTRDAKLFAMQDKLIDSSDGPATLAQAMKELVASSKASHLILITKHRAEARMRMYDGYIGSGRLAGLGFYVDKETELIDRSTGASSVGFFSPYAYLKVSLFEMDSVRQVRQASATSTNVVSAATSKTAVVAWDAMTSAQKFDVLKGVIVQAIDEAMPKVLDGR